MIDWRLKGGRQLVACALRGGAKPGRAMADLWVKQRAAAGTPWLRAQGTERLGASFARKK